MISIQFVYSGDIGSAIISYFGHGAGWSHVDAVLPDGQLLGARANFIKNIPAGVQIRPPGYMAFARSRKLEFPFTLDASARFYDFLKQQVGKPYDTRAIVGFAAGRNWRDADAWFCSELIAAALEACGFFPYPLASPINKIDPDDLYLAISAREQI